MWAYLCFYFANFTAIVCIYGSTTQKLCVQKKRSAKYATKSISKNGVCLSYCYNHSTCVRVLFKTLFRKQIKEREDIAHAKEAAGEKLKPSDEVEAIEDVLKRIDEIKEELQQELAQKKVQG